MPRIARRFTRCALFHFFAGKRGRCTRHPPKAGRSFKRSNPRNLQSSRTGNLARSGGEAAEPESAMRKAKGAPEPTPLELIEIAKGVPLNQNELTLAWQSKQGSAVSWMDSFGRRWVKKRFVLFEKPDERTNPPLSSLR